MQPIETKKELENYIATIRKNAIALMSSILFSRNEKEEIHTIYEELIRIATDKLNLLT